MGYAVIDLAGRATPLVEAIDNDWLLAWMSYSVIIAVSPFMAFERRVARRLSAMVLGTAVVALVVVGQLVDLGGTVSTAVAVPIIVVIMVETLNGRNEALGRHAAAAHAEALAGLVDVLTDLPNRRGCMPAVEAMGPGDSALLIDVDHFKAVNDEHGHDMGDVVLRRVASALRDAVRSGDVVGRWGGEEFVVVAPARGRDPGSTVPADAVRALADRLRVAVRDSPADVPVTVSIGAAMLTEADTDWQDVLRRADVCLYEAKRGGRDMAVCELDGCRPKV